jgi:hypothetical protein
MENIKTTSAIISNIKNWSNNSYYDIFTIEKDNNIYIELALKK